MAHELEVMVNGVGSMFYVGEVPWHGLGTHFEKPPRTMMQAIKAAGQDWTVELHPLVLKGTNREVDAFATVRSSDKSILGTVGPKYRVMQNVDAFNWFQPLIDAGVVKLHTAGSLKGGRRVWVLGEIQRDPIEIVKGDPVMRFIMLSNSHDGTMSIRVGFTGQRVVCANTLAVAESSKAISKLLRIRHTKKAEEALVQVREIMDVADQQFVATAEQYKKLAKLKVNEKDLEKYLKVVFKSAPEEVETDEEEQKEEVKSRLISNVIPLFSEGKGNNLKGVRGTMWAAYNAVTEFLTHERGNDRENRLDSLWFGESAKVSARALSEAVKLAA